jgi:23S rRNA (cytosine1962-C5)-methyltransferase
VPRPSPASDLNRFGLSLRFLKPLLMRACGQKSVRYSTVMTKPVAVILRKDLARTLRQGHPWVWRDAIIDPGNISSGEIVAVESKQGRAIVYGYWDARSPIAIRVLDLTPVEDKNALFCRRLGNALAMRRAHLDLRRTTTFRWVHGEADRLPGIHVDVYADVVSLRFDGEGSRACYRDLPDLLMNCSADLPIRKVVDRDSRFETGEEVEVLENGVRFIVDVGRGQKGGLFLDQRENRQAVAERARGKTLLNLFGYTGGFSVHAACAGATRTDTVDIARPAIEAARRNFQCNLLDLAHTGLHAADVFDFLGKAIARGETWDIVVSDPPSFAPSKNSLDAARKSYLRLHRLVAQVVGKGGLLCAASCSSHISRAEFLTLVKKGVEQAGRKFELECYRGAGLDHPTLPMFPEGDYLKFALGKVG